jgi:hypothetical protein
MVCSDIPISRATSGTLLLSGGSTFLNTLSFTRLLYLILASCVIYRRQLSWHGGLPAIWKNSTNDYFDDNSISHDNYYELNCYNAGVGPAIDVKIEWLVPQKRIVQYFIDMSEEYSDFINYDYNSKKITIKTSKGSISFQLFQDDELLYRNIVSIAPYNIHELISVSLPKSYLLYLSIYTYISFILEDKDEIVDTISPIELIIKFKDTGNKKYKEDKKIHFSFKKFNSEYLLEKKGATKNVNYAIGDFETI